MALLYIINTLAREIGADPTTQRETLVDRINAAAKELYESTDLPGSLREMVVSVTAGGVMALPYNVGPLRAMRNYTTKLRVDFKELAPRYNYNPWLEDWNNWRVMKSSPISTTVTNAAYPVSLSMSSVDTVAVTVNIVGKTTEAERVQEPVTFEIGDTSVQLTQPFIDYHSIIKSTVNNKNITITGKDSDLNDITLAVIPNDRLESVYTLVDVSNYPGLDSDGYMEILYKQPLFYMNEDGDTFPCDGFDDAIVYKALHVYYAGQADGGAKSIGYFEKANQIVFQRTNHTNGTTQKQITFAPCSLFNVIPRYGNGSLYKNRSFVYRGGYIN